MFSNIICPNIVWFEIWDIQDLTLRRCDTIKTYQKNFFKFSWVFHYREICKNQGTNKQFSRGQKIKILQKFNNRDWFCLHSCFHFYGASRGKTDVHNKYGIFNFVFGSFFEQDHLLNLFILGVYAKRWSKYARISKQKLRTIP